MLIATAGCFGKLASHADFLSSGLSDEFVVPWDQMVRRFLIASARTCNPVDPFAIGGVAAVTWGFIVQGGLCGKFAWLGACMPSRDRIGRSYPFMVGMPCHPSLLTLAAFDALSVIDAYCDLLEAVTQTMQAKCTVDVALLAARSEQIAATVPSPSMGMPEQDDSAAAISSSSIDFSTDDTSWWSEFTPLGRSLTRCTGLCMPLHMQAWI